MGINYITMTRYYIDQDFDKMISTNKYDLCDDEMIDVITIKNVNETWQQSVEIPLNVFESLLPYNNFKDLLLFSQDFINSRVDKLLSLKLFY